MGIAENEVVVDFLYKVRWQGRFSTAELDLLIKNRS